MYVIDQVERPSGELGGQKLPSGEGIADGDGSDLLAVLHVLGVERGTAGVDGGGEDKGVVDIVTMARGYLQRAFVDGDGEWGWSVAESANGSESAAANG